MSRRLTTKLFSTAYFGMVRTLDSTTADVNARRPDKRRCVEPGIDSTLAKHISHLFIRDPIVIFSETIDQDDENSNDHFEVRRYGLRRQQLTLTMFYVSPEYPINELADCSLQAASRALHHRLACRIPINGGPDDRLRECGLLDLRRPPLPRDPRFQPQSLPSHIQGVPLVKCATPDRPGLT